MPQTLHTFTRDFQRAMISEGWRAVVDYASLFPATPYLMLAPRGDGHTVLVLPGFATGDAATLVLRNYLSWLGYRARPWTLGINRGPATDAVAVQLPLELDKAFVAAGRRPVSLVGWSLGGIYARLLAHLHPHKVRQVITLGAPIRGQLLSTAIFGCRDARTAPRAAGDALVDIPSTSIFSRSDTIVSWHSALQTAGALTENIEIYSSHLGFGFNPAAMYAIADRLRTTPQAWQPFTRDGWKAALYGSAGA